MEEKELLKELGLPHSTYILRTFPFNKLAAQFTSDERKIFKEAVVPRSIRLLATLSTQTTNIPSYSDGESSFQEIHLFEIRMINMQRSERIYRLLAEIMPYPLLIRFSADNTVKWIAAHHSRIEKNDFLKMKKLYGTNPELDEELYLERWKFQSVDKYNLKTYYDHFIKQIAEVELKQQYDAEAGTEADFERLGRIKELEKQINTYIAKAKKEQQMNKRIEWQLKATQLKERKEQLIKGEE